MPKIVLLVGKSASGKSTAAKILTDYYNFKRFSFATPIKIFATSIGFKTNSVYGSQEDKLKIDDYWGISGREFMQKFGTEICRNVLPKTIPTMRNIWAKAVEAHIRQLPSDVNIVIDDGRFPDEIKTIRNMGGIIIGLERYSLYCTTGTESSRCATVYDSQMSTHASEQIDLSQTDMIIINDGTKEDLTRSLASVLGLRKRSRLGMLSAAFCKSSVIWYCIPICLTVLCVSIPIWINT